MTSSSYCDVFALRLDRKHDEEIRVGDHVRTGDNHFPHFEVIALHGDKAWLRDVDTGGDHIALRARCRAIAAPLRSAAE